MPGATDDGDGRPVANCTFCAIVAGDVPATRILETENLIAFLDIRPLFPGHTLLVPKAHWRLLSDLPAAQAAECLTCTCTSFRATRRTGCASGSGPDTRTRPSTQPRSTPRRSAPPSPARFPGA